MRKKKMNQKKMRYKEQKMSIINLDIIQEQCQTTKPRVAHEHCEVWSEINK